MEELLGVLLIGTVGAWAYREMRGRNGKPAKGGKKPKRVEAKES